MSDGPPEIIAIAHNAEMLNTIGESWGWTGLEPTAIAAANEFGNVIVKAVDGAFWRICPEALSCELIAGDEGEFDAIWADVEFQRDWQMTRLVEIAFAKLGPVDADRCYCLKLPAVVGGAYNVSNFATNSRRELLAFSGNLAQQIKDVPVRP